jgi:hypothetical protein
MAAVEIDKKLVFESITEKGMTKEEVRTQFYPSLDEKVWAKALKAMNMSRLSPPMFIIKEMDESDSITKDSVTKDTSNQESKS